MGFQKTFENIGKRVTGRGHEVAFSNSVEKYALENGTSQEEAEKTIFFDKFDTLADELHLTGGLDFDSNEYRDFLAGMRETFSENEIEAFKASALLPTFSSIPVTITPREFAQMRSQFQKRFEGKNPNNTILRDTAEHMKELRQLINRVSTCPGISTSPSMQDLILAHPDVADDFGRILYLKEQIDEARERFGNETDFDKDIEGLKNQTKEIFSKSTVKEVGTFFNSIWKGAGAVTKGNFLGAMSHATTALARITFKTGVGAVKLGYSGLKAASSYAKTKAK